MTAFALVAQLVISAPATHDGLQLKTIVEPGPIRSAREQVTVTAEVTNVSERPMRIVFQPSGPQPLVLFVDGEAHELPHGFARAALVGWVELKPGEHVAERTSEAIDVARAHTFSWRYVSSGGPYGRPLERCWKGTLTTPPFTRPPR